MIICICIILSNVLSEFYIINEYEHDCLGHHCKICQQIEIYKECTHNSAKAGPFLGLIFALGCFMYVCLLKTNSQLNKRTLITLKVELIC